MSDERPKPEHWDTTPKEVIAAEKRLTENGAVKVVSMWWSDPYVMGVLADGRTLIVSEPTHLPSKTLDHPGPPPDLLEQIKTGEVRCQECAVYGEESVAADVAYCCGLEKWIPVCAEHAEEMSGYGPEDCP